MACSWPLGRQHFSLYSNRSLTEQTVKYPTIRSWHDRGKWSSTSFIFIFTYLDLSASMVAKLLFDSKTRAGWEHEVCLSLAGGSTQVQICLTQRWHSHDTYSATGRQTSEKELSTQKESRHHEGESGKMGDVPHAEIVQIFLLNIVQQSGFMFASSPNLYISKNALYFTILPETFILSQDLLVVTHLLFSCRAAVVCNMLQSMEVMKFMAGIENGYHALPSSHQAHADILNLFLLWLRFH